MPPPPDDSAPPGATPATHAPKRVAKPAAKRPADPAPAPDYTLASSPHVRRRMDIATIMRDVVIALAPAALFGIYQFGWHAALVLALCIGGCVACEWAIQKLMGVPITIGDGSAAVTGLLLGMTLPPRAEWWLCVIGAVVAMGLGKHVFGGLGFNPFNPALLGRVVLLVSFPVQMTAWYTPAFFGIDAVTTATPLGLLQEARIRDLGVGEAGQLDLWSAFLGTVPGSIGETSALLLLLGGLFLLWRHHITWDIPVSMLGTVALVAAVFGWLDPTHYLSPAFHLVTGGVVLAAFFMATDMVTSPLTLRGKLIFGCGCGLLTIVIRQWGGYAEAVSFAVILMNAAVPIIDRLTPPRLYGTGRPPRRGPAR